MTAIECHLLHDVYLFSSRYGSATVEAMNPWYVEIWSNHLLIPLRVG